MTTDPVALAEATIRLWSGVECPNAAGARGLADLAAMIAELAALRGTLAFEDEPSSFEATLQAEKEPGR